MLQLMTQQLDLPPTQPYQLQTPLPVHMNPFHATTKTHTPPPKLINFSMLARLIDNNTLANIDFWIPDALIILQSTNNNRLPASIKASNPTQPHRATSGPTESPHYHTSLANTSPSNIQTSWVLPEPSDPDPPSKPSTYNTPDDDHAPDNKPPSDDKLLFTTYPVLPTPTSTHKHKIANMWHQPHPSTRFLALPLSLAMNNYCPP